MGHNNSANRAESFRNSDRHSENHQTRLASLGGELMTDRNAYRYHAAREFNSAQQHLPHLNIFGDDRHAHHDYHGKSKHAGSDYHKPHETHNSYDAKHHGKGKYAAHDKNHDSHKLPQKHDTQLDQKHSEKHPVQKAPGTEHKAENQKDKHLPSEKPQATTGDGERVTASWYHEGRKTANGERFKPDGLTVAHKSLPFGTLLEIKNPDNGHTVVARVNDRGPFIKGRDIDLSRGAARQLGMLKKGVGEVEYKIVGHA